MYICPCKLVKEATLREYAKNCMCVEELVLKTGASDCCGACREIVEAIFENPEISLENFILRFVQKPS